MEYRIRIGLLMLLLLTACSRGHTASDTVIASIEISPTRTNLITTGTIGLTVPRATQDVETGGQVQTLGAPGNTVQFTAVGKNASGNVVDNVSATWASLDPTIATIDPNGLATAVTIGVTTIVATSGILQGSAIVGVISANPGAAQINITGSANYEDKPFTINGFTGSLVEAPIRGAIVKVIAIDGFVKIAEGKTDENGLFIFSNLSNASRKGGIYLQTLSKTASDNPTQVETRNNKTERALFALTSSALNDSLSGTFTTNLVAKAASIGGAFNLMDVFSKSSLLVQQSPPCPSPNTQCVPSLLTAYWEPGATEGTFFDTQQNAIFISGKSDDPDEYDDTVIAHEYGHFILNLFSHDQSPGGTHVINDNQQDIHLSWSEGWASYFASAVYTSPVHVDVAASSLFSFSIEDYVSPQFFGLKSFTTYTTNEIAVAGVLWDATDTPTADDDVLQLGFNPVWQTVLKIQKIPILIPATMESFWTQFAALHPTDANPIQVIMQERKMELFADLGEGGEVALLVDGASQHHTLYQSGSDPTGDEDIIPFTALPNTQYTVETFNLTNGADTSISITDSSHAPLGAENDDKDATSLASKVSFTCTVFCAGTTTLHAHVKRSPTAASSTGIFGSYDIKLTSP